MGYNFTEQNYINARNLRYNDEKRIHTVWMTSIVTF